MVILLQVRQEAQLPQRDLVTYYVNKFVLCFTRERELERFQTAKVTFTVIQGHWQCAFQFTTYDILLVFHCN